MKHSIIFHLYGINKLKYGFTWRCDKEKIMLSSIRKKSIRAALNNRLLIPIEQKYPHLVLLQLYNHYSTGMFLKMTFCSTNTKKTIFNKLKIF